MHRVLHPVIVSLLLLLFGTTLVRAETLVVGSKVANVLTVKEIETLVDSDNIQDGAYFVCKCQINDTFLLNFNKHDPNTGEVRTEDVGTWDVFSAIRDFLILPVDKTDIQREIGVVRLKDCVGVFKHCHVNILFVKIPGKYADVRTLFGKVRRPVFHILVDYTGGRDTFLTGVIKGATWYLSFTKK